MKSDYSKQLYKDYEKLIEKVEDLEEANAHLRQIEKLYKQQCKRNEAMQKLIEEKNKEVEALKNEVLRLKGILNLDSNNSSIPTSKTSIRKNKRIPNSRTKSDRHIGGQPGHKKSKLEAFKDDEITEHEEHLPEKCPECGGELEKLDEDEIVKDETDYEVVVIRRRHHYPNCRCTNCGKMVRANIDQNLKEDNQYGPGVKSLALLLMNTGNVSVNKVRKMIYGLSGTYVNPSEGYISKLQRSAAQALEPFLTELRKNIITRPIVYWDDTVISIHTKRACLRYYGDEKVALYTAHMKKDKEGVTSDNILPLLSEKTTVMHDHNIINYGKEFVFNNIECNAHLLRELAYISENIPTHKWAKDLAELIHKTHKERSELIDSGIDEFSEEYLRDFHDTLCEIFIRGGAENADKIPEYYKDKERQVLERVMAYKNNYFAWVVNFEYPFTNNLSERSLRGVKSKMKISGQFQSETTAGYYAAIKSYIDTCYRNGINEYTALRRLCDGRPYTLKEILAEE